MTLREWIEKNPQRKYIMFGGKGGLGKTTFSAAAALWLAERGKKVLVFSVDPQASLSDIFERNIFGQGAVQIRENLWAQEIDADRHIKNFQDQIKRKILDMYGLDKIPEEIESYMAAAAAEPAMEESAIFDAVVDIVLKDDYDYYIYDLVPLGHALYYLSMASIYDAWINKITDLRKQMADYDKVVAKFQSETDQEEDLILGELIDIKNRINTSSRIFTDKERTSFFFVLTPEELTVLDTLKAAELFSKYQVPISGYVVNRALSPDMLKGDIPGYLRNKIATQKGPIQSIREKFGEKVLGWVPEFERDITGFDMIRKVADTLFV